MSNKTLKILVTGANGQLGKCIYDVAKGYPEYNFHFKSSKDLDITDNEGLQKLFIEEKYDYCINCAAYTAVDKAESNKEAAFLVNAEAVKFLAEVCKKTETTFIHISTDFVFDGTKTSPYTETDTPNPINVYGESKLKGEEYIQEILSEYFIIRTSWVYSEYGNNFVKTILRLAKEREELSVVDDQMGSPTCAGDLANVILKIIETRSVNYGLYHYSNEGEISWFDFAKEIFKVKAMTVKVKPISSDAYLTPARRPKFSILKKSKVQENLRIDLINWNESLKNTLK